jgi:FixJ family two-component response regulator
MMRDLPLVAVIDDDASVRKALSRLLQASEFSVECFSSGQAFLASSRDSRPDCVILDLQMPEVNGLELLRELRIEGSHMPVIIITAHDGTLIRAKCLAAGAFAYLDKPIDEAVLLGAIADAIR